MFHVGDVPFENLNIVSVNCAPSMAGSYRDTSLVELGSSFPNEFVLEILTLRKLHRR